ncbi:hypothetical protein N9M11_04390 [Flavobacteriaceae bacterium]|uniref:hypothetical protein n=1 Tax=Candidatus Arcticimaribacter forsetii TaxID=2820661 RepID=UPI0020770A76|nr:hypothetical protein [Candidatus Arcticimaribacter forsetii]MDA8699334.1 hypothetical protein [Flavobacteriaceae bacterium]MDB2329520.1 hypothetical protein [Flavobacteriaceae bacterium]MDB2345324.1 hypothetical protein [Flavobacteriaceae bacterium]MDB4608494.1 hypothetical protein [Flavobacteriaceae bacterium]MDB4620595.1 hypothetical protein [Flavobacteriaceae bacterium]
MTTLFIETNKQIIKNTIASMLLMSLLLPTVFQFVLLFEDHDHNVCTEQQVHVHESSVECEICTLQFSPLTYRLAEQIKQEVLLHTETVKENSNSLLLHSLTITNIKLRGPPALT